VIEPRREEIKEKIIEKNHSESSKRLTNADAIKELLESSDCSWDELRELALAQKWIDSESDLRDEEKLAALLENWDIVAEKLRNARKLQKSTKEVEQEDALFR
jgi:hypothetical protein